MADSYVWTVINLDTSISDSAILGYTKAAGIPSCLQFVFKSPFSGAWVYNTAHNSNTPMPVAPWTIVVSSVLDPRFTWNVAGLAVPSLHQATVGHWSTDSQEEMGARMWHEVLHCYGLPVDALQTTERTGFTEYLRTAGSPHYTGFLQNSIEYENGINHTQLLITFYMYLMKKYMECECFHEGCGQQPDVLPEDGYQPSEPSETDDEKRRQMNNLLLIGGGLVLLLILAR